MKKTAHRLMFLALLAGAFLAGTWYRHNPVAATGTASVHGGRKILRYACPMHPSFASERPGDAPCCGMRLEPVYADGAGPQAAGTVQIELGAQQRFGVRVAAVERSAGSHSFRLPGRVAAAEPLVRRLRSGFDGVYREVFDVTTGAYVKAGQPLAIVFGYDIRPAIIAYLGMLDSYEQTARENPPQPGRLKALGESLDIARGRLESLGLTAAQIAELGKSKAAPSSLTVSSPMEGFVIARNATVGERFSNGDEWFRIADLRKVWVLADAFGSDAEHFRPGMTVRLTSNGRKFSGVVSEVLPQVDSATRTMKVRLEVDNPDFALRPDMFVDVDLPVSVKSAITVPAEAVLNSGLAKRVFIDRGNGYFEPREVETGAYFGNQVEIRKGLSEGERIVVSGTFLVDSESRMRFPDLEHPKHQASAGHRTKDPVCGMTVDPAKARGGSSQHAGKTYHFCARDCKDKFDKEPAKYVRDRS